MPRCFFRSRLAWAVVGLPGSGGSTVLTFGDRRPVGKGGGVTQRSWTVRAKQIWDAISLLPVKGSWSMRGIDGLLPRPHERGPHLRKEGQSFVDRRLQTERSPALAFSPFFTPQSASSLPFSRGVVGGPQNRDGEAVDGGWSPPLTGTVAPPPWSSSRPGATTRGFSPSKATPEEPR